MLTSVMPRGTITLGMRRVFTDINKHIPTRMAGFPMMPTSLNLGLRFGGTKCYERTV
jgi:hypothetical protein